MSINSNSIKKALAYKHQWDMFFTELYSDGSHHSRIDALAIRLSWTKYNIVGYEIKASRQDYLHDNKWMAYLTMCNQLYFVISDESICTLDEVPTQCGLLLYKPTNTKARQLKILKKAPYREIEPPVEMYKVIMFRCIGTQYQQKSRIDRVDDLLREERIQVYKDYLEDKILYKEVGKSLSVKLSKEIRDKDKKIKKLEAKVQDDIDLYKYLSELLEILNLKVPMYYTTNHIVSAISEEIKALKSTGTSLTTSDIQDINKAIQVLNKLKGESN